MATFLLAALPAFSQDTLQHSIHAPSLGVQEGAQLGYSVATDGPYTVVGAPLDDLGAVDSGVVKVFDSTTGGLLFVLSNPDPAIADEFGWSVAISGTRVVVGARLDHTGATYAGGAYVYDLSGGTPALLAVLSNPSPAIGDQFGSSVAISGTRVVVGAPFDDTGAGDSGSVYVYDLLSGTPTVPITTLNNPSPATDDQFGSAVAISGMRVVVGVPLDDPGAPDAGSAYVYELLSGTPTIPVAILNKPGSEGLAEFGGSVGISGARVVVGTSGDDNGALAAGSVYVYDLLSGTPTVAVAILNNPNPPVGDEFAYSVAISGALVVVGVFLDDTGAYDAGSAYLYDLNSGTPTLPLVTLHNPGPAVDDRFGFSVAISSTRLVVGAHLDDAGAIDAGSAYVYDPSSPTPATPVALLNNPGPAPGDQFGLSVAISGTLVVVGAPGDDPDIQYSGSAYVYDLSSATPTAPVLKLNNPSPAAGDGFGRSVAISGTRVVAGAPGNDTGAMDAGSAYVYDLLSGTPAAPVAILRNPDPALGEQFGHAVAISGMRVLVGAYGDNTGAPYAGSAYVYDLLSGTPTVPVVTLNNPGPAAGDGFGISVAISGTRVVVGTPQNDTGITNARDAGTVYVYDLTSSTPTIPAATLDNPNPAIADLFGYSVAVSGSRLVVGTPGDDTGALDAGSAYVYDLSGGNPAVPTGTLPNPGPAEGDRFGFSVSISGAKVVVGAYFDDPGVTDAGSAYVYDLLAGAPTVPVTLNNPGPAVYDAFGYSTAIDGATVVIGAPFDNTIATDKGSVYVFGAAEIDVTGNAVSIVDGDVTPDSADHTEFGSVNISGGTLVRTFAIANSGTADLTLGAVAVSGTHAAEFSVITQPASPIQPGDSTIFQVKFDPGGNGLRRATLSFVNSDANENPFDFGIQGTGTTVPPSRVFAAPNGSDVSDCSERNTPCRNLSAAISQVATDGDVIVLSSGEYDTSPILISKGVKITSPSGTVAFIRQPITVNVPGGRVALRGLTLKGAGASIGLTLLAADSLSIEDTTFDGWTRGLHIATAAASNVSVTNSVFLSNTTGVQANGVAANRIALSDSRFEGNVTGLDASAGAMAVRGSAFSGNTTAISVTTGPVEITRSELWNNGTALSVLASGTARLGRSHVFGNTTGLSIAAGGTLESFGSTVIRGNGTNIDGPVTTIPEQ